MRKFLLVSIFVFGLFHPVFADDEDNIDSPNWGIEPLTQGAEPSGEASESVWEREKDNYIDKNYGSQQSPGFINSNIKDDYNGYYGNDYDSMTGAD